MISEKYLELLVDAGQALGRVETFIETIRESSLFPKNLSKDKEQKIKEFLRKKLISEESKNVLIEYKKTMELLKNELEKIEIQTPTCRTKDKT